MDTGDIQQSLPHWIGHMPLPPPILNQGNYLGPMVLKLGCASESPRRLIKKMLLLIPTLADSAGLGWALRISIANKFPDDAGLGTTLWDFCLRPIHLWLAAWGQGEALRPEHLGWGLLGNGAVPETMVRKAIGCHPREAHRSRKADIWRSFKTVKLRGPGTIMLEVKIKRYSGSSYEKPASGKGFDLAY